MVFITYVIAEFFVLWFLSRTFWLNLSEWPLQWLFAVALNAMTAAIFILPQGIVLWG
jgi:hypothetical protein